MLRAALALALLSAISVMPVSADGPGAMAGVGSGRSLPEICQGDHERFSIVGVNTIGNEWVFEVASLRFGNSTTPGALPCVGPSFPITPFMGRYDPTKPNQCMEQSGVGRFCIYDPIPNRLQPTTVDVYMSMFPGVHINGTATLTRV